MMIKGSEIKYEQLFLYDGQEVIVSDLAYDEYDQICTVVVKERPHLIKGKKLKIIFYKEITLYNEEFIFEFDSFGKCKNGEFKVYGMRG